LWMLLIFYVLKAVSGTTGAHPRRKRNHQQLSSVLLQLEALLATDELSSENDA